MTDARCDSFFLGMALDHASMSKDPNTRVGSVLISANRHVITTGFNSFPRGIEYTDDRLNNRDTKLELMVHGEMKAITNAARIGASTCGATLFTACTDSSGALWGGPPCCRCTVHVIAAGITEVVSWPCKTGPSKWADDVNRARKLLDEAGVIYREVAP